MHFNSKLVRFPSRVLLAYFCYFSVQRDFLSVFATAILHPLQSALNAFSDCNLPILKWSYGDTAILRHIFSAHRMRRYSHVL